MKIKKISQAFAVVGKILNAFTNSKQDTYSADYLNSKFVAISPTEPTNGEQVWIQQDENDARKIYIKNESGYEEIYNNKSHIGDYMIFENHGSVAWEGTNAWGAMPFPTLVGSKGNAFLTHNKTTNRYTVGKGVKKIRIYSSISYQGGVDCWLMYGVFKNGIQISKNIENVVNGKWSSSQIEVILDVAEGDNICTAVLKDVIGKVTFNSLIESGVMTDKSWCTGSCMNMIVEVLE